MVRAAKRHETHLRTQFAVRRNWRSARKHQQQLSHFMPKYPIHLPLIASLAFFIAGFSQSITDEQGRNLPAQGATAHLIEKHGWLATTEAAAAELMTPPKINLLAVSPEQAGKMARDRQGTHASPRIHIRRGHVAWQITGPRNADAFISANVLPRNDRGAVDWEKVAPETREKFLRCHKRIWQEPLLIGGNG
jgi:hypothetical protein